MVEIDDFLRAFIAANGIDEKEFKSSSRHRNMVDLRSVYCAVAREVGEHSLDSIGKTINRHHASVIHAVKNYNTIVQFDKKLKSHYNKASYIYRSLSMPQGDAVGLIDILFKSNKLLRTKLTDTENKLKNLKAKQKELRKEINHFNNIFQDY